MEKVIIYGSGQLGFMVSYILSYDKTCEVIGFIDDNSQQKGKIYNGTEVIGDSSKLESLKKDGCVKGIVSIGGNEVRGRLGGMLKDTGFELINAIHPQTMLSKHVKIGNGTIIGSGTNLYVNPSIGNSVFIGPSVTVSHDSMIGDNVLLSVGVLSGQE